MIERLLGKLSVRRKDHDVFEEVIERWVRLHRNLSS